MPALSGKVKLISYSLGSRLALRIKALFPDEIDLLLVESGSFGIAKPEERLQRYEQDQVLLETVNDGSIKFERFLERWYRLPLFRGLRDSPAYEDMLARRLQENPEQLQKALKILSVGRMNYCGAEMANWTGQLVYYCGELDEKYAALAKDLSKNWQIKTFPNASHNVHLQTKEAYLQELLRII